jgi:DNA-binding NarL/FixJ family response regulator
MPSGMLRQISPLLAEGYSDAQIAQQLNANEAVVHDCILQLIQLLNVSDRSELLLYFFCAAVQNSAGGAQERGRVA